MRRGAAALHNGKDESCPGLVRSGLTPNWQGRAEGGLQERAVGEIERRRWPEPFFSVHQPWFKRSQGVQPCGFVKFQQIEGRESYSSSSSTCAGAGFTAHGL